MRAAHAAADEDTRAGAGSRVEFAARFTHRLVGRDQCEQAETIQHAQPRRLDPVSGDLPDHRTDRIGEPRDLGHLQPADAGDTGPRRGERRRRIVAERRDDADAGDGDPPHATGTPGVVGAVDAVGAAGSADFGAGSTPFEAPPFEAIAASM